MISKNLVEVDLLEMFQVFGDIDECSVIREPNGHSKGKQSLNWRIVQ